MENPWEWRKDKINEEILHHARSMRKNPTEAEEKLWGFLRGRRFNGLKFRRQQHIEGFILDFFCNQLRLGIELDGEIHQTKENQRYDKLRTEYLQEFGISTIRFSNEEVLENIDAVLNKIKDWRFPSPRPADTPLPGERGDSVTLGSSRPMDTPLPRERGGGEGAKTEGEGKYFKFKALLQKESWLSPAYVGVDEKGLIQYISDQSPENGIAFEAVEGFALPGFQNTHSHAFQYAMAALAESHSAGIHDDFWTWREAMYQCAIAVDPDQAEAIAAMLYAEMLRHGYTHVAEFHYLHHDKDGKPYAHLAEMGERMIAAAKTSGINITLIPVFYQKGNFGMEPQPRQRRFISKSADDYFKLLEASRNVIKDCGHAYIGFGVHSLRAVELKDIITTFEKGPKGLPFHLHVAEQKKEVSDCLDYCGKRPMQWLLENLPVNERFHLVHATHLDHDELAKLAASKANVVLCPSTEGNLGDGIFRMREYVKSGGRWSIGTDSHVGLNPLEEFRMMDYRQRLVTNQRNTFDGNAAHYLVNEEIETGRKAMGLNARNHFATGYPLDAIVYDAGSPLLGNTSLKNLLATIVYSSDQSSNLGTLVNAKWVVKNQHHGSELIIKSAFAKAIRKLQNR